MRCGQQVKRSFFAEAVLFGVAAVSGFFRALGWRACRFYPSCSAYAGEAFRKKSFFSAAMLVSRRILRCHPFSSGGFDPVPPSFKRES